MRHHTREAANLDDHAFGADQKRRECLAHAHDGEDIDVEKILDFSKVRVQSGDGIVAASIVDEDVKGAGGALFNGIFEGSDRGWFVHFETQGLNAYVTKIGDSAGVSSCREDAET